MNIEELIQAWKDNEHTVVSDMPANPVGEELNDQELQEITGGMPCTYTCANGWTCGDWTGSL